MARAAGRAGASFVAGDLPLVGRTDERERIRATITRAAAGAGPAVLLTGAPGVGKSALLAAVRADAAAAGFLVLAGRAHEAERGLGYAPMIEALGPDLANLGARRARALVHGLPQLGRLFSGVPGRAEPIGDPAVERLRLVDALARLCERVAAGTPLLLTLDDLHWADGATLQLVHHLLRRLEGDRFLLVATTRIGAAAQQPEAGDYAAFLASARRLRLVDELEVGPLALAEVDTLLAALLPGATPTEELVAEVYRRTGGVPLFVAAVARSLADSDSLVLLDGEWTLDGMAAAAPLPPELRSVLSDRLSRLDPVDSTVLDLLAVHAAPLPHPVLLAASGLDEPDLLDALARLAADGATVEEDLGGTIAYTVSHSLLAEAATAGLPAVSRQRLHLALADAFQASTAPSVDALARHLRGAGGLVADARVVPTLLAVAEPAERRGDHAAAAAALDEAVTRLRRASGEPGPAVLERWAQARYRSGRVSAAAEAWQECLAAEHALAEPDRGRVAALHSRLAAAERDLGHLDAAAGHLTDAADAARAAQRGRPAAADGGVLLAGILADRFALDVRRGDLGTAGAAAVQLAELATRTGADDVVLEAGLTRAGLEQARGNLDAAGAAAAEALAAARRTASPALELRALATVLEVAVEAGAAAVIRAHADQALALARRLGVPAFELRAIGSRGAAGLHDGDWPACDRDMARALTLSRRFDVPRSTATCLAVRGMLQVFRGDFAAAESTIGEAQRQAAEVPGDRHVAGDVALARCRLAMVRSDERAVAELIPTLLQPGGRNVAWRMLTAAQALASHRRFAEIPAISRRLGEGSPDRCRKAMLDWTAGLALAGTGEPAAAAERLRAAAESLASQGMPYWAALARLDFVEYGPVSGPAPDDAQAQAESALDVLERLGARRDADRARRSLRRLGARPRPARRPGVSGGPLSARELEVARLFAEGLTTAEVSARLVLSPHTVTAHLRRIYGRLEVHSRAALTRILAERGLLGTD